MNKKMTIYATVFFSMVTIVLGFLITILKTKTLTTTEIGILALFNSFASIGNIIGLFGFSQSIIKNVPFLSKSQGHQSGFIIISFSVVTVLLLLLTLTLLILKPFITSFFDSQMFNDYYHYIPIIITITSLSLLADSVFKVYEKPLISQIITNIFKPIGNIFILLLIFILDINFKQYLNYYLVIITTSLFFQLFLIIKFVSFKKNDYGFLDSKFIKSVILFNSFMLFSGITHLLNNQIDTLMIGSMLSTSDVGIYSITIIIGNLVGLTSQGLTRFTHTRVSKLIEKNDVKTLEIEYKRIGDFQFLVAILLFSGILLYAKTFLSLFGDAYSRASLVAVIIGFSYVVDGITSFCGGIIGYSRLFKFDIIMESFLIIGNITLNYLLIPIMGIFGAAIATSITLIAYNIIKVVIVKKYFDILPFSFNNLKVLLSATLTLLFSLAFNQLIDFSNILVNLAVYSTIFIIIYASILYVLRYRNYYINIERGN